MPGGATELLTAFQTSYVSLPAVEVMILVGIMSMCLLFRWNRGGLLIAFVEAYRWGCMFFQNTFREFPSYVAGYYIFGGVVLILILINFFINKTNE